MALSLCLESSYWEHVCPGTYTSGLCLCRYLLGTHCHLTQLMPRSIVCPRDNWGEKQNQ